LGFDQLVGVVVFAVLDIFILRHSRSASILATALFIVENSLCLPRWTSSREAWQQTIWPCLCSLGWLTAFEALLLSHLLLKSGVKSGPFMRICLKTAHLQAKLMQQSIKASQSWLQPASGFDL
jgi:hypothetical protein